MLSQILPHKQVILDLLPSRDISKQKLCWVLVPAAGFYALYRYVTKNFDKWEKLGVPGPKPSFPFGTFGSQFLQTKHLNEINMEDYEMFPDDKIYGIFWCGMPMIVIKDPELVKQVFVKDFHNFVDRESAAATDFIFKSGSRTDFIWGRQLTSLSKDEWKHVRSTFSPIFTSGKLKSMMKFVKIVSDALVEDISKSAESGEAFEAKSKFGKFSMDSIATCAFGVDPQSFETEDPIFVKHAARIFKLGFFDVMRMLMGLIPGFSTVNQYLQIGLMPKTPTEFFMKTIRQSIAHRRETGERRNDMIDMMMQAMEEDDNNKPDNEVDDGQFEKDAKLVNVKKISQIDELTMVATAMVMMVAGYDTTAITISYAAYELAKNPEIMEKLQEEIDAAFEECNDEMPDYNTIQALPYLDMVIHETLRLHTGAGFNSRVSIDKYTIPGTKITLEKEEMVGFNISGIHMDPQYYPNPKSFNPENFSKEAKAGRHPYTFLAFGQGPRGCIGMRFALLEAKLALLSVLRKFTLVPSDKTLEPLQIDPSSQFAYAKGGLWIKAVLRNQ